MDNEIAKNFAELQQQVFNNLHYIAVACIVGGLIIKRLINRKNSNKSFYIQNPPITTLTESGKPMHITGRYNTLDR